MPPIDTSQVELNVPLTKNEFQEIDTLFDLEMNKCQTVAQNFMTDAK